MFKVVINSVTSVPHSDIGLCQVYGAGFRLGFQVDHAYKSRVKKNIKILMPKRSTYTRIYTVISFIKKWNKIHVSFN